MKYRKRPVEIEAKQFTGTVDSVSEIAHWMGEQVAWVQFGEPLQLSISTPEGDMRANRGDYIIKGIKGEFYPCKPDIFEQTYELVSGQE